jgi:hypothetical protein
MESLSIWYLPPPVSMTLNYLRVRVTLEHSELTKQRAGKSCGEEKHLIWSRDFDAGVHPGPDVCCLPSSCTRATETVKVAAAQERPHCRWTWEWPRLTFTACHFSLCQSLLSENQYICSTPVIDRRIVVLRCWLVMTFHLDGMVSQRWGLLRCDVIDCLLGRKMMVSYREHSSYN